MTPYNTLTTRALALILQALPIAWILVAPVGDVRARTQEQIDTLNALNKAGILDLDALTAIEWLLVLDGRNRGEEKRYRDHLVEAVGNIATELADRAVAALNAEAAAEVAA